MTEHARSTPETVLVTGGTGFIGSHLVDTLLARGRQVRALVRRTSNLKNLPARPGLTLYEGGLDDRTDWARALDGAARVYHVAGLPFARDEAEYFAVNHGGTETLLNAVEAHAPALDRFVLVSSQAAAGPSRGAPRTESDPSDPITPYGRSKLRAEEATLARADRIPVTIVRPPGVYGPRDYAIFELFRMIRGGVFPRLGAAGKRVSLIHARDLVDGIIRAGEGDAAVGRVYFLANPEGYALDDVVSLLSGIMGRRRPLSLPVPHLAAVGVALAAEALARFRDRAPVINRDKVRELSEPDWTCSPERAWRELGFEARIPLEQGLRETYDWYRAQGWL